MNPRVPLLAGSLEAFPAGEVLQWLTHRLGDTTVVFRPVEAGSRSRPVSVHVCDGVARALWLDGRPPAPRSARRAAMGLEPRAGALGGALVERGALGSGELRAGLGVQQMLAGQGRDRPLGRVLCDLGFVEPGLLDQLLREQALLRLVELFQRRAGEFAFYAGPPGPPGEPARPALPVGERIDHLLLRVAHAVDQAEADPTRV